MYADTLHEKSVVRHVDSLLVRGIEQGVSDIHLEPTADKLRVRFRIDGVLYDQDPIEASLKLQIVSRLKVLSHMNIAEKRVPQDGKFSFTGKGQAVDLRLSTFPSLFGEKMVVRILDRAAHSMQLDQLGFQDSMLDTLTQLSKKNNGFFLVTGPTGSGKTTTLYAMLSSVHDPAKNIVTLEDPVEYDLNGITQGHINPDAGFTFERGIRSLLRQDPDILMVGEIRDKQTARVAIEAALTGHFILSTLHTNDAPSALMRLMDMGIEPFLINASLTGILAQRLVRKMCQECRKPKERTLADAALAQKLGIDDSIQLYEAAGCNWCNNLGYKGRMGIFELLVFSSELRALVVQNPMFDAIYKQALDDGMQTLLQDGAQKVAQGVITLEELARVIA